MKKRIHTNQRAWVVTVDMGYGHQRAAYPLRDLANGQVISMNAYPGIPEREKRLWMHNREGYEFISRLASRTLVGRALFEFFDRIQSIPRFYPRRDLSRPNIQLYHTYHLIKKYALGTHLFTQILSKNPSVPLVTTFFLPAFAAELYGYGGDIFCLVCDADVSRAWVARDPKRSRIKYFAPNDRVVERLRLYGVDEKNIFLTGFPLPKENIGGPRMELLRRDLGARIINLDPGGKARHKFGHIIQYHLGKKFLPRRPTHPLTLMFSVGGAGAQTPLGVEILESLAASIIAKKVRLILVAGVRDDAADAFREAVKRYKLTKVLGKGVAIIHEKTKDEYFATFNKALHTTDVLWTKPSELSFYVGLGIPIIMAPSVGSQEDFNRVWLKGVAAGITQDDPRYTNEWFFDWVESGWLARAALNGFIEAPIMGTDTIEHIVSGKNHTALRQHDVIPLTE